MIRAEHRVTLEKIIWTHAHADECSHKSAQRANRGVDAAQEYRLVTHRYAVVYEPLACLPTQFCDLGWVVKMRVHEDWMMLGESLAELVVDAHGQHHGNSRSDSNNLDVLDAAKPTEDFVQAPGAQEKGVAATDQNISDAGLALDVGDGLIDFVSFRWLLTTHNAAPVAVATIDCTAVEDVEETAVGVLVEDAGDGGMAVFPEWVPELFVAKGKLAKRRKRLPANWAIAAIRIHERGIVRRGTGPK